MTQEIGPDRIIPTEDLTTTAKDGCVKIRKTNEWPANRETISIPTIFKKSCISAGNITALGVKRGGKWVTWSYLDYLRDVEIVAKAFIALGLEPHNAVCIFGFNAPEWLFSDIGAIFAGAKAVGLYPTNSADANKFIINDCECNILVVEDVKALEKMWSIRNDLQTVKKIVVYNDTPDKDKYPDVLNWAELMEIGKEQTESDLKERLENIAINQCCTLVYTSGTTGNPKGVMLSHDNIYWEAESANDFAQFAEAKEVIISYLPLSHIAGQMVDIWAPVLRKNTVYFADKNALKGTLLETLKEVRPTFLFGVPRVWEKIMEGMLAKGKSVKGLKRKIADACKQAGLKHHLEGKNGVMYTVGQKLIYKKVREALGLDRCHSFFTGAAPISQEVLNYFLSLDMVLLELYGMSETSGAHTMNQHQNCKFGTVGVCLPGMQTKLDQKDEKGQGEICMSGRHIMMGYLHREDKTSEDIDNEGFIHSGDLGSVDNDGFMRITGRKKELLITAGGENVAPVPIEDHIKAALPCISNAILIGDRQKFLTVFLTFKVIMDNDTPTNRLSQTVLDWIESLGRSNITTVEDILENPDRVIMGAIQNGIDKANKKAVSNAARVQKWTILPTDVSIPGGELGPTLKLKRFFFNQKYSAAVERFYN